MRLLDRIEELVAEATRKPWFFDNGIAPGADVFEAEDVEEFAQIMRRLAPLMLRLIEDYGIPTSPSHQTENEKAFLAYIAEHLPEEE